MVATLLLSTVAANPATLVDRVNQAYADLKSFRGEFVTQWESRLTSETKTLEMDLVFADEIFVMDARQDDRVIRAYSAGGDSMVVNTNGAQADETRPPGRQVFAELRRHAPGSMFMLSLFAKGIAGLTDQRFPFTVATAKGQPWLVRRTEDGSLVKLRPGTKYPIIEEARLEAKVMSARETLQPGYVLGDARQVFGLPPE